MASVKISYIKFLEEIQRVPVLDGGDLKSEITEDNRYRGTVIVPMDGEGGFVSVQSAGLENDILDAYEAAAEQVVHQLVVRHKFTVIDYNYKTISLREALLKQASQLMHTYSLNAFSCLSN